MSHEGIRIVSEEQAKREMTGETKLPADATTPLKVRVQKTEGTGVEIDWKDGHQSKCIVLFVQHYTILQLYQDTPVVLFLREDLYRHFYTMQ